MLGLLIKIALVCGVFGFQLHRRNSLNEAEAQGRQRRSTYTREEIFEKCIFDKKDYYGGDIYQKTPIPDVFGCRDICVADYMNCKAFTWATWKMCFLKNDTHKPLSDHPQTQSGKPDCLTGCNKPTILGGTVSPNTDMVARFETYTVTCDSGYTMEGSGTMTCMNGMLSPAPTCNKEKKEVVVCEIKDQVYTECGSACTATCDDPAPVCTKECVKKCQCPTDAPILHENKCIARAQCPAKLEITATPKKDQVSCKANKKKCQLEYAVSAKEGDKDIKVGAKSVQVCKLVEGKTEGCKKVSSSCKSPDFCLKLKPSAGDAGEYVAVVEFKGQKVVSDPVTLTVV